MRRRLYRILCVLFAFAATATAEAAPRVVVSIAPVHALVAGVMEGVGEPYLLVRGGASPHTYSLRPSAMQRLHDAEAVFWVGEPVSPFLAKPLRSLGERVRQVELLEWPGLHRLPARAGGVWSEGHEHQEAEHDHGEDLDPHIWLDPRNAAAIVQAAVTTLAGLDPANAARYRENGDRMAERLAALDQRLKARLTPVRDIPYLVFHDAYQYLEHRYGLRALGAVTVSPDRRPGARRLSEIRRRVEETGAVCLFREPQFPPSLVQTIRRGTGLRSGVLDPLGADLEPGPGLYGGLMEGLADALTGCLARREAR